VPIETPKLDDLDYATLRDELIRRIPQVAPEWTNHNDSDPGITLIQLFAYLGQQIGYRLNRVPEKNYLEFLKLLGVKLRAAQPSRTLLSFLLTEPETATAFLVRAGTRIKGKTPVLLPGATAPAPPVFETDVALDAVPAQLAALVTTLHDDLRQIRGSEAEPAGAVDPSAYVAERFTLVWDGKTPKLKDMPTRPVAVFKDTNSSTHLHLWIGLAFNPDRSAGFLGSRVTLTVQMDDDEQPNALDRALCGESVPELADPTDPTAPQVQYAVYRPAPAGSDGVDQWKELLPGDSTDGWTRSGEVRFDVPLTMGPVPDSAWQPVRAPATAGTPPLPKPIAHPLIGALKNPVKDAPALVPVSGWLRVSFPGLKGGFALRMLSFNMAPATNAEAVERELLDPGTGRPAQRRTLAFGNVLPDTLTLAVEDPLDNMLHTWKRVEDFDSVAPDARVYTLDAEAGEITFGDGRRGLPPPAESRIVAMGYRHGGGQAADVGVGDVSAPDDAPVPVQSVVNVIAARGGRDAEPLADAKLRVPRELRAVGRAVTAEDFQLFALQTPGVRVRRAEVLPLRKPYDSPLDNGPGVNFEQTVPGALSVVVVPDKPGPYPMPTEGELRKVCQQLDTVRLVTTEVFAVPPQYVRVFNLTLRVKARAGVTRTALREAIAADLTRTFHVLTGGPNGQGLPFGQTVHHADLVARVFSVDGVERVELLEADFDGLPPEEARTGQNDGWRLERLTAMHLTACVVNPDTDVDHIDLRPDENLFVDASNLAVSVV
jgi:hypothetical protein